MELWNPIGKNDGYPTRVMVDEWYHGHRFPSWDDFKMSFNVHGMSMDHNRV